MLWAKAKHFDSCNYQVWPQVIRKSWYKLSQGDEPKFQSLVWHWAK